MNENSQWKGVEQNNGVGGNRLIGRCTGVLLKISRHQGIGKRIGKRKASQNLVDESFPASRHKSLVAKRQRIINGILPSPYLLHHSVFLTLLRLLSIRRFSINAYSTRRRSTAAPLLHSSKRMDLQMISFFDDNERKEYNYDNNDDESSWHCCRCYNNCCMKLLCNYKPHII